MLALAAYLLVVTPSRADDPVSLKGCLTYCFGTNAVAALVNLCDRMSNHGTPDQPPPWPPPLWPPSINSTNLGTGLTYMYIRGILASAWDKPLDGSVSDGLPYFDISSYAWAYDNAPLTVMSWFQIQSSSDMVEWHEEITVTNYWSINGCIGVFWKDKQNVATTYAPNNACTNVVPVSIATMTEPKKFFRLATTR